MLTDERVLPFAIPDRCNITTTTTSPTIAARHLKQKKKPDSATARFCSNSMYPTIVAPFSRKQSGTGRDLSLDLKAWTIATSIVYPPSNYSLLICSTHLPWRNRNNNKTTVSTQVKSEFEFESESESAGFSGAGDSFPACFLGKICGGVMSLSRLLSAASLISTIFFTHARVYACIC